MIAAFLLVQIFCRKQRTQWRGGLPPLGCEAAPNQDTETVQINRIIQIYDGCAAERGQAPSPQLELRRTHCTADLRFQL
ncbi:hypothetical protein B0D71_22290 [Pseudomonas laurylsulfativorans]|uniref:Uncharacterized protein n=1 Tax=Pseudomonas laurylsulfativorans TaxID=1943631 RepID=A0A2S3VJR8_9PSED|nr:hypothetical protein B0D71_22290 [Pseudomonas laurylsulfativorans]